MSLWLSQTYGARVSISAEEMASVCAHILLKFRRSQAIAQNITVFIKRRAMLHLVRASTPSGIARGCRAAGARRLASFYDDRVKDYIKIVPKRICFQDMLLFDPRSPAMTEADLITSARLIQATLPSRLARRIDDMNNLPYGSSFGGFAGYGLSSTVFLQRS